MQDKTQIRNNTDISAANLVAAMQRIDEGHNHSGGDKDDDDQADYYMATGGNTIRSRHGKQSNSKRLMCTSLDIQKSSMMSE